MRIEQIKGFCVLLGLWCMACSVAAYDFKSNGIYYRVTSLTDSTVCVVRGNTEYSGHVVVPSYVEYNTRKLSVVAIADYAFSDCKGLLSVTIPGSVVSVGNYAFDNCRSLKTVIIEDGKTELLLGYNYYYSGVGGGEGLFHDSPLDTLYLGRNIDYRPGLNYGNSPFNHSESLSVLTIGRYVSQIPDGMFHGCTSLVKVIVLSDEPFVLSPSVFSQNAYVNGSLCVSASSVELFDKADVWKNFFRIEGM